VHTCSFAFPYTNLSVSLPERFTEQAVALQQMGADSLCIKDMAGLISRLMRRELVSAIKAKTGLPLQLHSH
jgi:oxaloacetate decarboxylase alpha subunit